MKLQRSERGFIDPISLGFAIALVGTATGAMVANGDKTETTAEAKPAQAMEEQHMAGKTEAAAKPRAGDPR